MSNGIDYVKAWLRISWLILISGLLVLGLSAWLNWPTTVTLIAMTASGIGVLMKITSPLLIKVEGQKPWYLVAPPLVILIMLLGISPVLLTLAYVHRSTALLRAAAIVAGISVLVIVIAEIITSQLETLRVIAKIIIPRRARSRPTESSEEDNVPLS